MSSETVLFQVEWVDADGANHSEDLVARLAPDAADEPVFADYALDHQFELLARVAELTDVPVPRVRWLELDPEVIGSPFVILDRVDGVIPPDISPYTFGDNWLFDASPEDQRRVQDRTVEVLATLHGIDTPEERFAFLTPAEPGATPLARHVGHSRAWYDYAVSRAGRSNLVEAGFEWLEANWPEETPTVLLWGDARLGNVIYRDFEPVAVLDWEMASLGPREVDLGWMIFGHMVFEEIATVFELPPMEGLVDTRISDGGRNRPAHLSNATDTAGSAIAMAGMRDLLPGSLDPTVGASHALDQALDGRFYCTTHPGDMWERQVGIENDDRLAGRPPRFQMYE
jgi:aminoglycoside phosphotransferase (APT) family kinase protein